jgi:vacuolar-type H+-ATPase subunit E/Vma4
MPSSMDKIYGAILEKVNLEASQIIKDAEEKSKVLLDDAQKQNRARYELCKNSMLVSAEAEASRILAKSAVESRRELSLVKTEIIEDIFARVKQSLIEVSMHRDTLLKLISDSVHELGEDEVVIYVAKKDETAVRDIVASDKKIDTMIKEVRTVDCLGGVIVEDITGNNRIDNTFDTRLQKLMSRILPDIQKELFS